MEGEMPFLGKMWSILGIYISVEKLQNHIFEENPFLHLLSDVVKVLEANET